MNMAPSDPAASERLAQERSLIAEGETALTEGRLISDEEVDGWLDRLAQAPGSDAR
ncbi:MAG: hypothetical protein JWP35_1558 [Caulobacter sp.]|nr:hypothetical protein [Caulobacter sp.]